MTTSARPRVKRVRSARPPNVGEFTQASGSAKGVAFATPAGLRRWLERNQASKRELIMRCYKVHAKAKGVTYSDALDEALCYGWIDGVRRSVDGDSFTVRFTPRKPRSIWSAVNIAKVRNLEAQGRMQPAGVAAFSAREDARSGIYAYESKGVELSRAYEKELRANKRAWSFFQTQAPWYRRTSAFWVMSAKREATRAKRLGVLIACSAKGETVPPFTRARKRSLTIIAADNAKP